MLGELDHDHFIIRKNTPYQVKEFSRRRCVDIGEAKIWMVSPEDLVLSKLHWAKDSRSELQMRDARNLIACAQQLDWQYIETWARDLAVSDLLAEVRS